MLRSFDKVKSKFVWLQTVDYVWLSFIELSMRGVAALRAGIEVPNVFILISDIDNRERACAYQSNPNLCKAISRSVSCGEVARACFRACFRACLRAWALARFRACFNFFLFILLFRASKFSTLLCAYLTALADLLLALVRLYARACALLCASACCAAGCALALALACCHAPVDVSTCDCGACLFCCPLSLFFDTIIDSVNGLFSFAWEKGNDLSLTVKINKGVRLSI